MTERLIERYWLYDENEDAWQFYSSEYDVWPTLSEMVNLPLEDKTVLVPIIRIIRHDDRIFAGYKHDSDITLMQAEAAQAWSIENKLFEKCDQGIHRIEVNDDVREF